MPQLSMFTPCGMLELTSEPSHAERIYFSIVNALSQAFDMSQGTRMEAWAYATAMMMARAQYALDRAGNQAHPLTACDLIPLLEQAYLVVPSPGETLTQRAATLAAIDALQAGGRLTDIASGLRALLGTALLAVVPTGSLVTPTSYPSSPGSGGGNWVDPRTPYLWLQLVDPVVQTGAASWCGYEWVDTSRMVTQTWEPSSTFEVNTSVIPLTTQTGFFYQATPAGGLTTGTTGTTEPTWPTAIGGTVTDNQIVWTCAATVSPMLTVGQTVTVQGENTHQIERVTVSAVAVTPPAGSNASVGPCFQATFTKSHDIGASVVTGQFPYLWSTQRQLLVVLSSSKALDRETRRKVDEFMRKVARGVDIWATLAPVTTTTSGGTVGGISAGYPMGTQPFTSMTFVNTT